MNWREIDYFKLYIAVFAAVFITVNLLNTLEAQAVGSVVVMVLPFVLLHRFLLREKVAFSAIAALLIILVLVQYLASPYLITVLYLVTANEEIDRRVKVLAEKYGVSGVEGGYISYAPFPNAFTYGNVFTGYRVVVTYPLLLILDGGELDAVIMHELGHIKHRDVEALMALSLAPTVLYWLGRACLSDRDDDNDGVGAIALITSILMSYQLLKYSRIREYYADAFAKQHGYGKPLAKALAKLAIIYVNIPAIIEMQRPGLFSQLFISSGEGDDVFRDVNFTKKITKTSGDNITSILAKARAYLDEKAEELVYKCRKPSIPEWAYYIMELGSDHPSIVLRIKALIEEEP